MFDTARKNLKGQLLAAESLDWVGLDLYVIIPWEEAKEILATMERLDAGAVVVSPVDPDPRSGFVLSALGLDG